MKKLFLLSLLSVSCSLPVFSQITYLADTAFTTDAGLGGAPASCVARHTHFFGFQMGRPQNAWIADVFTVPAGDTWVFDTVIVYGYQSGSGLTSTFLNCNLQIYQGTPGLGGTVVWGDTSTNVLASTGFTGIYRVDTLPSSGGLTNNTRPIMYLKLYLATPARLSAGTYWLSWSTAGSLAANSCPGKVLPGRVNPSGQSGRQMVGGTWNYVLDSSLDIGFNKIIKASAAVAASLEAPFVNNNSYSMLRQNVPNPFNGSTAISFNMTHCGYARLTIYNSIGQSVATLCDGQTDAGEHQVTFSGDKLPAGVYYYQLTTDSGVESKQMIMVH